MFQFQRYVSPGCAFTTLGVPPPRPPPPPPPPPPPCPTAASRWMIRPSTHEPGAGAGGVSVAGGATGRMLTVLPVRRSVRTVRPSCASEYTVWRSVGSTAVWNPSPLFSKLDADTSCASRIPMRLRVALGPPQPSLSCSPEYTLYGRCMSAVTQYASPVAIVRTYSHVAPWSQLTAKPGVGAAQDVVRVRRIDPVRVLVDGLVAEAEPFVDGR